MITTAKENLNALFVAKFLNFVLLSFSLFLFGCVGGGGETVIDDNFDPGSQSFLPVVSSVSVTAGSYTLANNLDISVTFDRTMYATSNPRILLYIGGANVYANYLSGSGGTTIIFRHVVTVTDYDIGGIDVADLFDESLGTLRDVDNSVIKNGINSFNFPTVYVDGIIPSLSSVTFTASTYTAGQNIDLIATFNEPIFVTVGTPRIELDVGGTTRYANYLSGSGTSILTFRHTAISGDTDFNGVTNTSVVDLNGGLLRDFVGNNSIVTYTTNMATLLIDATPPSITGVTPPANASYINAQNLDFTVAWDENTIVTGNPRIAITLDSGPVYADYFSGTGTTSHVYRYTVAVPHLDLTGIALPATMDLNGGTLRDAIGNNANLPFTNPVTSSILVDAVDPTISSVTPPANGTYKGADNVDFTVNFSEAVNIVGSPRIQITLNSGPVYATYQSGTGTANIVFRYTVGGADLDTNGIVLISPLQLNGGTIKDAATNDAVLTYTLPATNLILIDGVVPTIIGATDPGDGMYILAQNLDFTITYDEAVIVVGAPRIVVTLTTGTVYADHFSGSGGTSHVYRYTVVNGNEDANGIVLNATIDLNGGTLRDAAGNNADVTYTDPGTTLINIDGVPPVITGQAAPANATYILGQNLDFPITYDDNVFVVGTPRIAITLTTGTVYADYNSGHGTNVITFRYTVALNDEDANGLVLNTTIQQNGGTIRDTNGNDGDLTYTDPGTTLVNVDGNVPDITGVTPPANNTYMVGDNLDFTVAYDQIVDVTGGPRIEITLGSGTVHADYQGGTGTANITYRYTVAVSDLDTDGIVLNTTIDLNGGTLLDVNGNTADVTYTDPGTTLINVDGVAPTITSLTPAANQTWILGENVDFIVNYDEAVVVTGAPRIQITLTTGAVYADYQGGSGTANITYRYTVANGNEDTNGLALNTTIDLNTGTLKDAAGNDADLTYTDPGTAAILIDGVLPAVTGAVASANATYSIGQNIDITLTFDDSVDIVGAPRLTVTLASGTTYADYSSGTGTNTIVFRYPVVVNDLDTDGIFLNSTIDLNGGTIRDTNLNNAVLTYVTPNTTAVLVDGVRPFISTLTPPANATYISGQNLDFVATYNEVVNIVGTPRIVITLATGLVYADYQAGTGTASITYRYSVGATDSDGDGIALNTTVDLNAGTIKDVNTNDAVLTYADPGTASILVDAVFPSISLMTPPANTTYFIGQNLDFTATYTENVNIVGTPRIEITLATGTVYADYQSGTGTTSIVYRYTVLATENDTDGIVLNSTIQLNGGTIKDTFGNDATLGYAVPNTTLVNVDGIIPSISSVTPPVNATYSIGDTLNFTVNYDEAVNVTGTPQIQITLASGTVYADYQSGTGTANLLFSYAVIANDNDTNGIALTTTVGLNGGTIADLNGNNANLTFVDPGTAAVLVDGVQPTISGVTPPVIGTYMTSDNLDFTVTFNENVNITGTPRIQITLDTGTVYANYQSGTGTTAIVFRYSVLANDNDSTGIALLSPLALNAGTIKDVEGNDAILTFAAPGTALIFVDAIAPNISSVTPPGNATYGLTQNIDFTVNFSEAMNITGTPRIVITLNSGTVYADYNSGTGTANIVFRYSVAASDLDADGIVLTTTLDLNAGTVKDLNGNDSTLTFVNPGTASINVDGVTASITGVTPPAGGTYIIGQNIDFTVVYDENVTVTGTPRIPITLTSGTVYADYLSGSGGTNLVFRYSVATTDLDANGIALTTTIDLNGGTMVDPNSNNVNLTYVDPGTGTINVDGVLATITGMAPPANATYIAGQNLDFTATFDDNVDIAGTPRIAITLTSGTVYADYNSGTGTTSIVFRYTVGTSDLDANGIVLISPLELNGGTIDDANNNAATLTYGIPGTGSINIDGIAPTITGVTPPANATYKTGDNLDFTVAYDENVDVVGTPRIEITLGSGTVYANYSSGTGTSNIVYRYSVAASDLDTNGIALNTTVQLNTGTLLDSAGNAADLTYTDPGTASINVDGVDPSVGSMTPPANGTYIVGQNLDFTANFNETVAITGVPRIAITLTSGIVYADYNSGTGSANIVFRYTVSSADIDANGIALNTTLDLNGGTIADTAGNNATLTYVDPGTAAILVDGVVPTITGMAPPANATYISGQNLDFTATFDDNVDITGTPRIAITLTSGTVYADYNSGTGTSNIVFRYTVGITDLDANGIVLVSPLDLNGGAIEDTNNNNATLTYGVPGTGSINVDGIAPTITGITPPANATYIVGQNLDFTVAYDENVDVTGTPRIAITLASGTVYADYNSGTGSSNIVYRYTVSGSDVDTDGIALNTTIQLNTGTLLDSAGNAADLTYTDPGTTLILVDGVVPTIGSMTPPANGTYIVGQNLDFTANFNENVIITGVPRIVITLASGTVYADYSSGTGTSNIVFRYSVSTSDLDTNGITLNTTLDLNAGTIADAATNNATLTYVDPGTAAILVDGVVPTITGMAPPANATYITGQNLDFTATFDDNVDITGTPRIAITLTSGTVYADYSSGTGTANIVFRYTVGATDVDANGIVLVSPVDLNGGAIEDTNNNNSTLTYAVPGTGSINVDGVVPTITGMTPPANSTYIVGQNLDFTMTYDENVDVTGTPRIEITLGSGTVYANYNSGTGTANIVYRYTVASSDLDTNGIAINTSIDLNAGTLLDSSGNAADLTYTDPGTASILVDGVVPTVSSMTPPANGTYIIGQNLDFTANFNENVTITGVPRIVITLTSGVVYADYSSGTGTSNIVFRYTVAATDLDANGIALNTTLDLNAGTIADAATNNATLTYVDPGTAAILVDGVAPSISSVTPPANNDYILADNLDFTVTYDVSVTISGSPRIPITLTSGTVYATYLSGSPGTALTFRYPVGAGDSDTNGITLVSPLDLNSGTIKGTVDNNDGGLTYAPPATGLINVDGTAPTITGVTAPANATYIAAQDLDFTVAYDESVDVTGAPRIAITLASGTVYADYQSGTGTANIVYRYSVTASDLDTDGIALNTTIDLNGGTLKDSYGNDADLTFTDPGTVFILVDAVLPVVSSITPPANGTYIDTQNVDFTANFSESVTITGSPRIQITLGSGAVNATYVSGSPGTAILFRYTVATNDLDGNGIALTTTLDLNAGTIKDAAGNDATLTFVDPGTASILVDAVSPTITSVTPPANTTYKIGDDLDFTVNYDDAVDVVGAPRIQITLTSGTVNADYLSGTGTANIIYRYTVAATDLDANGIALNTTIDLNGGTLKDAVGNDADLTYTDPGTASILVDGVVPTVSSVTAPANADHLTGSPLSFTVTMSENTTVTGTPRIVINLNTGTVYADYTAGTGTTSLSFSYASILSTDGDNNGIVLTTTLDLNAGSLKDAAGNDATLTFADPGTGAVLVNSASTATFEWQDNGGTPIANYDYGTPAVNTTQTFRVANTGAIISGTPTVSITNTGNAHFSIQTDNCTAPVTAGSFCTVVVLWTDAGVGGLQNGNIRVTGTPGGTDDLTLQGTK